MNVKLSTGKFKHYHKSNEEALYINIGSNHSVAFIKQPVDNICWPVFFLSTNKDTFKNNAPYYNAVLERSCFKNSIDYIDPNAYRQRRRRKILWFNHLIA